MWLIILSDQLPIVALVSRYLTNKLMGRRPVSIRKIFQYKYRIAYYSKFLWVIREIEVGNLRVTHPSAKRYEISLDLHVLSPPLAFALSQDQTLQLF